MECLGTEGCNPVGEVENLVSCHGCGQSVHPSCRVYSTELVNYYEQHGWICDECKPCIVCDECPSESDKSEDLLVCEYCDQGIHYSCLHPRPDKRPEVWNCDDCRRARGMDPHGNINKFRSVVPDVVNKTEKSKLSKPSKKSAETPELNGHDNSSDTETEATPDSKKLTTTSSEVDKSGKKRRKSEKKAAKSKEVINTTDSESDTEGGEPPSKVLATSDKNTKSA